MAEDEAPGWDAIDAAIAPIVGSVEPLHFGTSTGLPDQDGLWGLSAYRLPGHWFYVTYGLTELFGKVSYDPEVSGWGHELTMRVVDDGGELPEWPLQLLLRLGELVYQRETPFLPWGYLEFGPDIPLPLPPAVGFAEDPHLGTYAGPHGEFTFTCVIGLDLDQLAAARATSLGQVVDTIGPQNPELVCGGPGLRWG